MIEILACVLLVLLMVVLIIGSLIKTIKDTLENPDDYDITK